MSKMTNCKACGKEIAKGAKTCPSCGKDQRSFFGKHKILTVIIILIILGGIGAATGNKNEPSKVGENKTENSSNAKTPATKTFKVGDVVQLKDYKVTVNSVRKGNGSIPPQDSNNEYLYVDTSIENISSSEQAVSSIIMFKVQDKDGRSYNMAIPGDQKGQLDGKVAAGRKITGEYVVEVPKDKTGFELVFDSTIIASNGQVIVELN